MHKPLVFLFCLVAPLVARGGTLGIQTAFVGEMKNFALAGSGEAVIDWGDGSAKQIVTLRELRGGYLFLLDGYEEYAKYLFSHIYSAAGMKTITIIGNITGLYTGQTEAATGIDVSRMPSLQFLDCSREQLNDLNVNNNTMLTYLSCTHNQLSCLDLAANTALSQLYCQNNQLSELNISQRNELVSINCCGNRLNREALIGMFASLPSQDCICKIGIYKNPGVDDLTPADINIAYFKGWAVY
jgi:hypothetical protein